MVVLVPKIPTVLLIVMLPLLLVAKVVVAPVATTEPSAVNPVPPVIDMAPVVADTVPVVTVPSAFTVNVLVPMVNVCPAAV